MTIGLAGCAPVPAPTTPPTPAPEPTPIAATTLDVTVDARAECRQFPWACAASLSVLPAGTVVTDTWRPPLDDPRWTPAGWDLHLGGEPIGTVPLVAAGTHELVFTILQSDDLPSYLPDGSVASDVIGRCVATLTVPPVTPVVDVRVAIDAKDSDGGIEYLRCSIETEIP